MVIQSIHFVFAPEDADEAEGLLRQLQDASRKEHGVIGFEVGRGTEKPNVFALWEEYRDKASLEAHIASEHFQRLVIRGVRTMAKERNAEMVVPIS